MILKCDKLWSVQVAELLAFLESDENKIGKDAAIAQFNSDENVDLERVIGQEYVRLLSLKVGEYPYFHVEIKITDRLEVYTKEERSELLFFETPRPLFDRVIAICRQRSRSMRP